MHLFAHNVEVYVSIANQSKVGPLLKNCDAT